MKLLKYRAENIHIILHVIQRGCDTTFNEHFTYSVNKLLVPTNSWRSTISNAYLPSLYSFESKNPLLFSRISS